MLSTTINAANSALNCQNLQKSAKLWNTTKKIEILVFLQNKICTCRRGIGACFHHLDFQSKDSLYVFFIVKKWPLYVNFSIPLAENDFFFNVSHFVWIWDFEDIYLTHLETRIWRGTFHIYFRKWSFWLSKLCCLLWAQGKKLFCQLWMLWSCKL